MQRTQFFGLVIGLLSTCVGDFVFASESDELRERAKAIRKEAAVVAERGNKEQAERMEQKALDLLEAAE